MNEKELLEKIQGLIADSTKGVVKAEDLEKRIAEINKEITAKLDSAETKAERDQSAKELKENVDKLIEATTANAAAIKAMSEVPKRSIGKSKTFKQALEDGITEAAKSVPGLLVEKNDDDGKRYSLKEYFTKMGNQNTPVIKIDFDPKKLTRKDAVDMLESNIVEANVSTVRMTELDPQREGVPLTIYPHVLDWMPSGVISKKTMSILVAYTFVDGTGTKTEGDAPSKSSLILKTVEFPSFVIATYATLSDEALDDLPEALDELNLILPDAVLENVDDQVLGSAGDDSSALAGMLTANKMTAFTGSTTYADSIEDANKVDVFATMARMARVAKMKPDILVLNPTDILLLASEKDQLDNSKTDRRVVFNKIGEPIAVAGMRIQESESLTANRAIVTDSKKHKLGIRKGMTMEIGYNGTDFTEGQKTVKIGIRLAYGVRNKAGVIYCSDIDQAKSDINIS